MASEAVAASMGLGLGAVAVVADSTVNSPTSWLHSMAGRRVLLHLAELCTCSCCTSEKQLPWQQAAPLPCPSYSSCCQISSLCVWIWCMEQGVLLELQCWSSGFVRSGNSGASHTLLCSPGLTGVGYRVYPCLPTIGSSRGCPPRQAQHW